MTYSTRIFLIKLIFPVLGGIALVLALFWNWGADEKIAAEFDEADKVFEDTRANVQAPSVDILTAEGDRYDIRANEANGVAGEESLFEGDKVQVDMSVGGARILLTSLRANVDNQKQTVTFIDNVQGEVDGELSFESESMTADMKARVISGDQPILARRSDGEIRADRFKISEVKGAREYYFEGGVEGSLYANEVANE